MTPESENLFATDLELLSRSAGTELHDLIASAPDAKDLRIQRILSPPNHGSPPGFHYDQPDTEWILLLSGSATLRFTDPDDTVDLNPGDHLLIPPHRKHRIDHTHPTDPTLWLAVHWS